MNLRQSTVFLALCCSVFLVSCGKDTPAETPATVSPPVSDTLPAINTPVPTDFTGAVVPLPNGATGAVMNPDTMSGAIPAAMNTGAIVPANMSGAVVTPPPATVPPVETPSPLPTPGAVPPVTSSSTGSSVTPVPTTPSVAPKPVSVDTASQTISFAETYMSPAGKEDVTFTFSVEEGKIKTVTVVSPTQNEVTRKFITKFDTDIKSKIVGVAVKDLANIDTLGGSSLTPVAYNKALAKLKK